MFCQVCTKVRNRPESYFLLLISVCTSVQLCLQSLIKVKRIKKQMILTGMLNVVLRRVLYEHGRRGVRLRAPDEYGVVCEQAPGRQGPGLDAPGPHLG